MLHRAARISFVSALMLASACTETGMSAAPLPDDPTWTRITEGVDRFLDRAEALDEYAPGVAVVIVDDEGRQYIRMHGVLNEKTQTAATEDSAFYIASMTKAYMGLLAARLDAEGILKLDTVLTDYWPDVVMPEGVRPASQITLRDLITHQIPVRISEITFLEAYLRDVAPEEYPGLINKYAEAREEGFRYDNLGYNIYAAILQAKTGRNWRDWLDEGVFTPLGLDHTSGRASDFPPADVAWGHVRKFGHEDPVWVQTDDWFVIPPKTDGKMQSAGGLMTTANDMAAWLRANLNKPAKGGLTPMMFEAAQAQGAAQEGDGDGFSCDGYAFGWNRCEYLYRAAEGETAPDFGLLLQHGGGYIGHSTYMTVARDMGLGVAVFYNSDNVTAYLGLELTKEALERAKDLPQSEEQTQKRLTRFTDLNKRYADYNKKRLGDARADAQWGGWNWAPSTEDLAGFAGTYVDDDAMIDRLSVDVSGNGLLLQAYELTYRFDPAVMDVFGGHAEPFDPPEKIEFRRDDEGAITGFAWDDDFYVRQP